MENLTVEDLVCSDWWNLRSVETIGFLQDKLVSYESSLVNVSVYGDNRQIFTFFFPILAGLSGVLGARVLWAATIVEWSNLILKWQIKGDRPFWWIGETSLYDDATRPSLRQFPNTCESGPGTPSGHVMINVAVFYVASRGISSILILKPQYWSNMSKWMLTFLLYTTYVIWISLVFISRLYIQAHFLHQCLLGIVFGLLVGHLAWSSNRLIQVNKLQASAIALFLVTSAIMTYYSLLSQGMDPLWTVTLALKYCAKAEYVKIDSQPFYLIVRFTATALGLGYGVSAARKSTDNSSRSNQLYILLGSVGGMLIGRMFSLILEEIQVRKDDVVLYLSASFCLHAALPMAIVGILPQMLGILHY